MHRKKIYKSQRRKEARVIVESVGWIWESRREDADFFFVVVVALLSRFMLSIYYLHGIASSSPPPSLVNRYSTYVRKINTLQRLPKPACSHLLHPSPPLRAFRRASGGLINFIWSKRAATYTHTVSLSLSPSFSLLLFPPFLSAKSQYAQTHCVKTDGYRKVIFSTSIVVNNNLRERHEKILIIIEIVHFISMTFFFVLPLDLYPFDWNKMCFICARFVSIARCNYFSLTHKVCTKWYSH